MPITISKSKFVSGLQCPKLLWTHFNDRDAIPAPDASKQAIFDAGHVVGDLAKQLQPNGVEVPWSRDLDLTVSETHELLPKRVPVFEASFLAGGGYCRADIMVPVADEAWDLCEVKSAATVKDVNIWDVAFQADVIERSGVKLDRLFLVHLNREYVRDGDIDVRALFHVADITAAARARQPEVAGRLAAMHAIIAGDRPDTPIGRHCFSPYDCDLWNRCSAHLPEHPVLDLTGIRKTRAFRWIDAGLTGIADLPTADLNAKHRIQQETVRTGRPHIQPDAIRAWLGDLEYPLYCLDFETMNPAVPLLDGTRPFQQVAFQFSLHIVERPGAAPTHVEFLAETHEDPRPALAAALRAIGPDGTILAYNMQFERMVLRDLASVVPVEAAFLAALDARFQDLMDPFGRFWYHDPRQHGSCSLKAVLPLLTDTTYAGMVIGEGGQAQREFQRAVFGEVGPDEKARVLQALRDYCRQDTQALVDVLEALRKLV